MRCIFIEEKDIDKDKVTVKEQNAHHLKRVLRFKLGEEIELKTKSSVYLASLVQNYKDRLVFKIIRSRAILKNKLNITLCQALIKEKNFILSIKKATELGASKIVPYCTTYSRGLEDEYSKQEAKLERWNKICVETSEQCGNDNYPIVTMPITNLKELTLNTANRIIANEKEKSCMLKEVFVKIDPLDEIIVVIGPEGGFTTEEIINAKYLNFISSSIGQNTLKSETAGLVILSNLLFYFS